MSASCLPPLGVLPLVASQRLLVLLVLKQVLREFGRDFPGDVVGLVVPVVVALRVFVEALLPNCHWFCTASFTDILYVDCWLLAFCYVFTRHVFTHLQYYVFSHVAFPPRGRIPLGYTAASRRPTINRRPMEHVRAPRGSPAGGRKVSGSKAPVCSGCV